jgi:hypothetical protein
VAVDVRVEHANLVPGGGERGGQVHRHRRLADPTLAAGHGEDLGQGRRLGERDRAFRAPAAKLALQLARR